MEITDEVQSSLRRGGAVVTWLFGSRATGLARPASDIDLAVLTADGQASLGLLKRAALASELEELLAAPVDLVDFRTAPLELRARIVTTGQLLHSDDEALRVRTVVLTQSRWEDVRPAVREMDQAYLTAVSERGLLAQAPGRSA